MAGVISTFTVPTNWAHQGGEEVKLVELSKNSSEYRRVQGALSGDSLRRLTGIVRVQNPYLYGRYLLRKQEYIKKYGHASERTLLHATAASKVNSIVKNNLDWRLVTRCKFGKGVSFSPCATYANKECSRANGNSRAMLYTKVLINDTYPGSSTTRLPPKPYDTTTGNNQRVFVKYYDDEFYPEYVAYYTNVTEPVYKSRNLYSVDFDSDDSFDNLFI